jgi:acetyltransferase-like isoleucine patch superfamily enzyme
MRSALVAGWNRLSRGRLKAIVSLAVGDASTLRYDRISRTRGCTLAVGQDCIVNARISFDREGATVIVGDRCYIGTSHLVCAERIILGDDVVISWGVTIVDHNSHAIAWEERRTDVLDWARGTKNWANVKTAQVTLGDRTWVGFNAIILKGVTIGEGAIVAAGAVVTKDVPPNSIVAGNPARVIRTLNGPDI